MTNLFNKVACLTDIHFGNKGDSREFNIDCENFILWFIDEAKKFGADTCIFLGDWHHNRSRINVSTLNYSLANIEQLGKSFDKFYFITGNHDLFYRDKREINSVEFGRNIENVTIVSEPLYEGNVAILPWLIGDEWKQIKKLKSKYVFGHFELPHFKMNAMIEMPDHGQLKAEDFVYPEYVFSGHFHKRQKKNNIQYIGNCFPHSFADTDDDERGMMLLEWGKDPIFKAWPGAPKYRKIKLSQLLNDAEQYIDNMTYVKVESDLVLQYDDLNYIKDLIINTIKPRELTIMPMVEDSDSSVFEGDVNFETVDSVVLTYLDSIDSNHLDKILLSEIYRNLS